MIPKSTLYRLKNVCAYTNNKPAYPFAHDSSVAIAPSFPMGAYNSGHTATLCSAQIRQSRISYVRESIDENSLRSFLEKASSERRMDIDAGLSLKDALEKLKLTKNAKLTNASILLFGKEPQKFFNQSEVKCARFKGNDTTSFLDIKEIKGNIIDQIPNIIKFIKEHIKLSAKIEGIKRVEKWEYPIEALREAVTNAICHRDYEDPGNAQIRIFDNRIEIWSPGLLPDGITPRILEESHRSIPRNRSIADCFFLIKYIEKWGTGTNRIITECKKHGLPKPKFEERAKSFVVVFSKLTGDYLISLGLNERQINAIEYLKERDRLTNKEYMELNSVSRNTASNELMKLVEKGILKQTGKGRGSYYEVV